jgi:hypothetical protein
MPFLKLFISLTLAFAALSAKAQAPTPNILISGKYEMHLKINDRVFVDYLSFNCTFSWSQPCTHVILEPQLTTLKGYLEVPNIFKAPLQKAIIQITEAPRKTSLSFEILAKENGQEFKVYYTASIPDSLYEDILSGKTPPTFVGTATLDGNKILGDFTAVKIE